MDPVTVTLTTPIEHDGKTITALTFREAELGDLIAADSVGGGDVARSTAMLASMCGVPIPALRKLKAREFARILKAVEGLLGNGDGPTSGDGEPSRH